MTDALGVVRLFDALLSARTLVSEGALASMTQWSETEADPDWGLPSFSGYGLGLMRWDVDGLEGIGHGGDLFGYQAHAYYFPAHDATFVLLVNGSSFSSVGDNLTARVDEARDVLVRAVLAR